MESCKHKAKWRITTIALAHTGRCPLVAWVTPGFTLRYGSRRYSTSGGKANRVAHNSACIMSTT